MTNIAELSSALDDLKRRVSKLEKAPAAAPAAVPPVVRPPASGLAAAYDYAQDGYANDGVQRRYLGTHPGNLDEARTFSLKAPEGWDASLYEILVLTDYLPTPEEKAASAAGGGGFSDTFTRWAKAEADNKPLSASEWWAEIMRQRAASAGTPDAGASGDRG